MANGIADLLDIGESELVCDYCPPTIGAKFYIAGCRHRFL
jgi:hypothetical protein